ncbi:MAG: hypothetical protein WC716_07410 [Chitinophagaceae bacterium]|jgi:hypothetical protein
MKINSRLLIAGCSTFLIACGNNANSQQAATVKTAQQEIQLPAPGKSHVNFSKVIEWPEGKTPMAPEGFR